MICTVADGLCDALVRIFLVRRREDGIWFLSIQCGCILSSRVGQAMASQTNKSRRLSKLVIVPKRYTCRNCNMRHSRLTIRRGFARTTRRGHENALTAFASECHAFGFPNCTTHLVILGHKKIEHVCSRKHCH